MQTNAKLMIGATAVLLLAAGGEIAWQVHKQHVAATATAPEDGPNYKMTLDDNIYVKREHQMSMKDARDLNGKRIWVHAGGQMNAFAATPAHVDYSKDEGLLLGAEPLDVVNFIEQPAGKASSIRIPAGSKQAVMLFHRANDEKKLLGVPVGYLEDGVWTFYIDEIFFYEDPHTLYKHWGPKIWQAVDAHKVEPGMNELQTQLALGQVSTPGSGAEGNRTVEFFNNNHPISVTFVDNKATTISGQYGSKRFPSIFL